MTIASANGNTDIIDWDAGASGGSPRRATRRGEFRSDPAGSHARRSNRGQLFHCGFQVHGAVVQPAESLPKLLPFELVHYLTCSFSNHLDPTLAALTRLFSTAKPPADVFSLSSYCSRGGRGRPTPHGPLRITRVISTSEIMIRPSCNIPAIAADAASILSGVSTTLIAMGRSRDRWKKLLRCVWPFAP